MVVAAFVNHAKWFNFLQNGYKQPKSYKVVGLYKNQRFRVNSLVYIYKK